MGFRRPEGCCPGGACPALNRAVLSCLGSYASIGVVSEKPRSLKTLALLMGGGKLALAGGEGAEWVAVLLQLRAGDASGNQFG